MEKEKCKKEPGGHLWNWDEKKGKWVCLRCGEEKY